MPARLQSYSSLLKLHFCGEHEHTKEDLSVLLLNLDTVPQNSTVEIYSTLVNVSRTLKSRSAFKNS